MFLKERFFKKGNRTTHSDSDWRISNSTKASLDQFLNLRLSSRCVNVNESMKRHYKIKYLFLDILVQKLMKQQHANMLTVMLICLADLMFTILDFFFFFC